MKELIPKDEYGVFADTHDTVRVDSLFVAQTFEKRHDAVLRDISKIIGPDSGISAEFNLHNFVEITYKDSRGRKQPAYAMTRDGFMLLIMGYTGKKAMKLKELYIRRFNEMEDMVKTLVSARQEFPLLTETIKMLHENPKPYHYSNECDMINRVAFGMSAKQFKIAHGIPLEEKSIRPYLTPEQIELLNTLQTVDIGFLVAVPNYQKRKALLQRYRDGLCYQALSAATDQSNKVNF